MKPLKSLLIIFMYFSNNFLLLAQKETNVWVFESDVGIDFNYNRFRPFNGTGMQQSGGSASMCDKRTGQLLFYTNGRNVWNRDFENMPNGYGLRGGFATTQAALIIPLPNKEHLYYLVTTKSYSDTIPLIDDDSPINGLYYSIIDMDLDGGRGDVVRQKKNILLMEKSTEKLTAIPHANGSDVWLISHEWGTDRFIVFLISEQGIGEPKYYPIGSVYGHYEAQGWMLPSPNGKMIASAVYSGASELYRPLELYNFDNFNGEIFNLRVLGNYGRLFGVSFSPDNTKLYFTYFDQYESSIIFGGLFQMDLSLGSLDEIRNSVTELFFLHETGVGGYDTLAGGSLQLAPDGRLYVGMTGLYLDRDSGDKYKRRIFYIDKPNLRGWACSPTFRRYDAYISTAHGISYPNFMQHYFNGLESDTRFSDGKECLEEFIFEVYPNPTKDYLYFMHNNESCVYPLRIYVYNPLGQLIDFQLIVDFSVPIVNLRNYASGLYIIRIDLPYRRVVKKILKS